jgi:hypothetical protein
MSIYEVVLNVSEQSKFSAWWRGLTSAEQDEIRGTLIEPQGFVDPFDWFANQPSEERQAVVSNLDWDIALCEETECENCPRRIECHNA